MPRGGSPPRGSRLRTGARGQRPLLWHRDRHITSGRVARRVLGLDGDGVDSSVSLCATFRAQLQGQVTRDYPVGREIAVAKTRDRLIALDGLDFAGHRSAVVVGA